MIHADGGDRREQLDAGGGIGGGRRGNQFPALGRGGDGGDLIQRSEQVPGESPDLLAAAVDDPHLPDVEFAAFRGGQDPHLHDRGIRHREGVGVGLGGGGDRDADRVDRLVPLPGQVVPDLHLAGHIGRAGDFKVVDVGARLVERIPLQRDFLGQEEACDGQGQGEYSATPGGLEGACAGKRWTVVGHARWTVV